jgi:hypothetical protein
MDTSHSKTKYDMTFPATTSNLGSVGDTRIRNRNGKRHNVLTACTSLCAMQTQSKTWFPSEGLTSPGLHVKPWRESTSPDYRAK